MSGTPSISEFNPTLIPFQYEVISDVKNFDYANRGLFEVLLSGAFGSAKSMVLCHLAVLHCLENPGAKFLIGRKAMPDLRDTLILKILEHLTGDLVDGEDYHYNRTTGHFHFPTLGSDIYSRSWADKNFKRFRSLELSSAAFEELTENDDEYFKFYSEAVVRIGRIPGIAERFVISATNPDAPSHPVYQHFMEARHPNRKVYYSVTKDNPFLPNNYVEQIESSFTKEECRRYLYGEWLEINRDKVYYAFGDHNVIDGHVPIPGAEIVWTFDFNIGEGKPMSAVFFQKIGKEYIFFAEIIMYSANTLDVVNEAFSRGILKQHFHYVIRGDANGRARSTKYNRTDYEVIAEALRNTGISFEIDVSLSNPPVRKRHVIMNGQLKNSKNEVNIKITKNCKTLLKGFRLTKLKKGSGYIEDDGPNCPYQHCTTAAGYGILRDIYNSSSKGMFKQSGF